MCQVFFYWGRIWAQPVRIPVAMTSKYQNLSIASVGVNLPTYQLQGKKTLQDTNHNEEENYVGVSYDADCPILVANLPPASVDEVESAISEGNRKTTITDNYAYSMGVRYFLAK